MLFTHQQVIHNENFDMYDSCEWSKYKKIGLEEAIGPQYGECCSGCQNSVECYATCKGDQKNPCGKLTNDPLTCSTCPMCIWWNGLGGGLGKCVPRQAMYSDDPSFSWSGYAPWYSNLYYPL